MKYKLLEVFALIMGLWGLITIWIFSDWRVAVGVFLCLYANNISQQLKK